MIQCEEPEDVGNLEFNENSKKAVRMPFAIVAPSAKNPKLLSQFVSRSVVETNRLKTDRQAVKIVLHGDMSAGYAWDPAGYLPQRSGYDVDTVAVFISSCSNESISLLTDKLKLLIRFPDILNNVAVFCSRIGAIIPGGFQPTYPKLISNVDPFNFGRGLLRWSPPPLQLGMGEEKHAKVVSDDSLLFIIKAEALVKDNKVDSAIDIIYEAVDEFLREGKFSHLNTVLESIDVQKYSIDIILALLTATLPVKSRLSFRKQFVSKATSVLEMRGEYEDGILNGLA